MKNILLILLLFPQLAFATIFTIAKGDHYSSPTLMKPFVGSSMNMTVIFDASARYEFPPEAASDQADTNKLYGFADCGGSHMQNSARFGWRWYDNRLDIMAFTHRRGKFYYEYITSIKPGKSYEGSIEISDDKERYVYIFDGVRVEAERGCDSPRAIGYHLQPYFGGQQIAPHEVSIIVKLNETFGPAIVDNIYPNPVRDGKVKMDVSVYENVKFHFNMYDMRGRLVHKTDKVDVTVGEKKMLLFDIGRSFSSAMYLVLPIVTITDGTELRANIESNISDRSMKLIIMN